MPLIATLTQRSMLVENDAKIGLALPPSGNLLYWEGSIVGQTIVTPKSSPKRMETENSRWEALGGHQFFGATLKILALTEQIRRK